jgi:hypothetical protein
MTHPAVPRRLDAHPSRTREQRRADVADRLLESLENLVHRHRGVPVDADLVAAEVAHELAVARNALLRHRPVRTTGPLAR